MRLPPAYKIHGIRLTTVGYGLSSRSHQPLQAKIDSGEALRGCDRNCGRSCGRRVPRDWAAGDDSRWFAERPSVAPSSTCKGGRADRSPGSCKSIIPAIDGSGWPRDVEFVKYVAWRRTKWTLADRSRAPRECKPLLFCIVSVRRVPLDCHGT